MLVCVESYELCAAVSSFVRAGRRSGYFSECNQSPRRNTEELSNIYFFLPFSFPFRLPVTQAIRDSQPSTCQKNASNMDSFNILFFEALLNHTLGTVHIDIIPSVQSYFIEVQSTRSQQPK